ncbi:hypothetical protein BGZ83_011023 [Gryganskiella cystojenkinii]|nr:hypothetical protein BGZ83_011023 [Gryganskiella cystojenkinii]
MGHKRKKFSDRVADRNARGHDESPFKNAVSDTPKGFARILYKKESMEQRRHFSSEDLGLPKGKGKKGADGSSQSKNDTDNKNNKNKNASDDLRIQPGERMGEFSRRVDEHMRDKMMKATKDITAEGSKKKKYFEKLKAKEQAKKLKVQEEKAYQQYETIQDKVRLNDVAEAPPMLTAVPKKRKNDEFMANKKWKNTPGEEDFADVVADVAGSDPKKKKKLADILGDDKKEPKKSKLKNMTPAGRRILEEERKKAIENYRMMKARSAFDRSGGDDEDAAADDAEAEAAGY